MAIDGMIPHPRRGLLLGRLGILTDTSQTADTGVHAPTSRHSGLRLKRNEMRTRGRRVLVIACVLAASSLAAAPPVEAKSESDACRVRNVTQGTGGSSFRAMVDAAVDGDRLRVRGTCQGGVVIRADIRIRGMGDSRPALTGGDRHRVIRVAAGATVTLRHLVIAGGARDVGGGGGIRNAGTVTLRDTRVRDNRAGPSNECGVLPVPTCDWRRDRSHNGGGLLNYGMMTIVESRVTGNEAGEGAGIANHGTMELIGSVVSRNVAGHFSESAGGGILNAGTMTIRRSTVAKNWVVSGEGTANGGGIFNSGPLVVINSTVSKNHAVGNNGEIGGGIANGSEYYADPGNLTIISSTVARNRGGGVYSCPERTGCGFGSTVVASSIVAHNTVLEGAWWEPDPEFRPLDCSGDFTSDGHNLIRTGSRHCRGFFEGSAGDLVGTRSDPIDARLGPLAFHGEQTPTHALLAGSPAIDAAGRAPCAAARDQRGTARPQGPRCDIGAIERR